MLSFAPVLGQIYFRRERLLEDNTVVTPVKCTEKKTLTALLGHLSCLFPSPVAIN
jgi:hypothetical protein